MSCFSSKIAAFLVLVLLLSLVACGGGGSPASEQDDAGVVICPRAQQKIAIDGKLEQAWRSGAAMRLDDPADVADPNGIEIFTLWDEQYLYVAFEVSDRQLVGYQYERDHKALYKDDMIEVLLDPRQDRTDQWLEDDIVYHINTLGQVKDDRGTPEGVSDATWDSRALFAVHLDGTINDSTDSDRGYCVELAIPWEEIGKEPENGTRLGINFAAGDAEGPDEHLWDWRGAHPFRQPTVYGTLILTD